MVAYMALSCCARGIPRIPDRTRTAAAGVVAAAGVKGQGNRQTVAVAVMAPELVPASAAAGQLVLVSAGAGTGAAASERPPLCLLSQYSQAGSADSRKISWRG
jgi:hypothetical protein